MPVTVRPERGSSIPLPHQGRWPDLETVPGGRLREVIARLMFRRVVRRLDLRVELPGGRLLGGGDAAAPVLRIVREQEFFRRLGANGKLGFGEAYMVGAWTTVDLSGVLTAFAARMDRLVPRPIARLRRLVDARTPTVEENDLAGAQENISRHYDLSNEMFGLFLDETMTYSSALFEPGDTLADAQRRKVQSILDLAAVGPGSRVVEIGTGWGTLAIRAAERGADVDTLTISVEQQRLAEQRIADAGMAERVRVLLQDYRDAHGQYDAVVSVEMIEAVGERYWPAFFRTLDRLLVPGGRVALQAITMAHDRMLAVRRSYTWIQKYIFPGGLVPSLQAIETTLREHTTLRIVARRDMGQHYAETLQQWRERFVDRWDDVRRLGFDGVFRRMWEYYLASCEAAFRTGHLNVCQLALARDPG